MNGLARVVFAVLVVATFGAFFVAQRLKHAASPIERATGGGVFSPNGDGRSDRVHASFALKRSDVVAVDVVDANDAPVRSLLSDLRAAAHRPVAVTWDGLDDHHHRARDGAYRLRVTLRDAGRSVLVHRRMSLDTRPPAPQITSIDPPHGSGPALLPNADGGVTIHTSPAGPDAAVVVYRTAFGPPREVARLPLRDDTATWDGRVGGRPASAGSFVAVAQWRDAAGNLGSSVAPDPATHVPVLRYGRPLAGRGGITVRYLEAQPPSAAVRAGSRFSVGVDARGRRYSWDLRALGVRKPVAHGATSQTPLTLTAPHGLSGVYLFEARLPGRAASTPIAVEGRSTGRVLVVLPLMTWQGRNPVDDDGDGAPDLLDRGVPVRGGRVFARGRLPQGFAAAEGPLLSFLARNRRSYDVTTDVALAAGRGPRLAGHHGVLLPGDTRWLPHALQLGLRDFVRRGGVLALNGIDSLRREVTPEPDGTLTHPTPPAPSNLFGASLRAPEMVPTTVTNLEDHLDLFRGGVHGGTGVLMGYPGREETASLGPHEQLAADAVTGDGRIVLVAARFGRGLEIRTGLVDFATRLGAGGNAAALVLRTWSLLAGA